jgi:valyl-tRNA synthetase
METKEPQKTENYDPKVDEPKWQEFWHDNNIFKFDPNSKKEIYSIDTPPPYASADHLHVGHGMHYSQFEFVARFQRMRGKNVFFPMGYDDNGLPTERYVEKKYNINKSKTTRADFIKLCLQETEKTGKTYQDLFNQLGFSVDWDLLFHTISDDARRVAQLSFIDLHEKGRMERTDNPTSWCTTCQTTIAQADFENTDVKSHFNDIIFKCGDQDLIIATTRPELLPACVALFHHPDDKRYKELKGKKARVPLFDYEVPILTDESVDIETGTGLMMVCTFGDKEDIEKWRKYKLDSRIVLNENGTLNDLARRFVGMKTKEARKDIIAALQAAKLLINQKEISHPVNVHERCGTEIEFMQKQQWQIKILDKKEDLIKIANKVNWYPEHMKTRYEHWVKNLQWDWGISRQRYYGVPFPVWYCKSCGKVLLPDKKDLPVDPREQAYKGNCSCGSTDILPEMDVMDTWMTSSCSPQINADWGGAGERKNFIPMSLRPQAHDIIRTWAFYTIVKSYYHTKGVPWKDIMISGHGQDPHGQKMSKSKGNFIIAQDVIKKYSADAFRFWAASVKLGDDLPYQEKDVLTGQKTINKLWNASKFSMIHLQDFDAALADKIVHLQVMDKWILSRLHRLIKLCTDSFDVYEYSKAKMETEKFFWGTFCDYYLEICKDRLYNPDKRGQEARVAAQFTLYNLLLTTIKLTAPIMPHITEAIYQAYFAAKDCHKSIHVSHWPEAVKSFIDEDAEKTGDLVVEIIGAVRKFKSEKQVSLKKPIKLVIECDKDQQKRIESALDDLKATTTAAELTFGNGTIELENSKVKVSIELVEEKQ